jgi:benzoate membrane transport protein
VRDESHREAALITFLVTLSGVTIAGVGSAFWGVVAGAVALGIQQLGRRPFASREIATGGKIGPDARATADATPSTPTGGKTS